MPARYLNIEARQRPELPTLAAPRDFTATEDAVVDAGIVLSSPNISLYCLDDASQQAIFTELPPTVDLTTAPFVYRLQFEQAERLIAMPYAAFRELAHSLPKVPAHPDFQHPAQRNNPHEPHSEPRRFGHEPVRAGCGQPVFPDAACRWLT